MDTTFFNICSHIMDLRHKFEHVPQHHEIRAHDNRFWDILDSYNGY